MENIGFFRGTTLMQTSGKVGGARSVFVKLKGIKNDLVYPPFGGVLGNYPTGNGFKFYAGDLFYFDWDAKSGTRLYLLKTYEVLSTSGSIVNIVKNGFRHKPFVGDKLGVAPEKIGGESPSVGTITKVEVTKVDNQEVWACTMDSALTANSGDILVEIGKGNSMLIPSINAVADCDGDIYYEGGDYGHDYNNARYLYTPALGGVMFMDKMSPLPQCVKDVNQSKISGWFAVQPIYK